MTDCFEDEALADSPDLLWLFRDGAGPAVTDLSGNSNDGSFTYLEGSTSNYAYNTSTTGSSITITRVSDFGDGSLILLFFEILNTGGTARTITPPAGWTTEASFLNATNDRYVCLSHVAASGETSYTFTFSTTGTSRVLGKANHPRTAVAEVAVVDASGNITLPDMLAWRRVLIYAYHDGVPGHQLAGVYSNEAGSFPNNSVSSLRHTTGNFSDPVAGTSLTSRTPGQMIVQLAHDDPQEIGWSTESGICDTECSDVNGSLALANWLFATGDPEISIGTTIIVDAASPFSGTFEALVRLHDTAPGSTTGLQLFGLLLTNDGGSRWEESGRKVPSGDCWTYLTGSFTSDSIIQLATDDFDSVIAEVAMVAVYASPLDGTRTAAHRSHFCGLCHSGRGLVLGSLTLN